MGSRNDVPPVRVTPIWVMLPLRPRPSSAWMLSMSLQATRRRPVIPRVRKPSPSMRVQPVGIPASGTNSTVGISPSTSHRPTAEPVWPSARYLAARTLTAPAHTAIPNANAHIAKRCLRVYRKTVSFIRAVWQWPANPLRRAAF